MDFSDEINKSRYRTRPHFPLQFERDIHDIGFVLDLDEFVDYEPVSDVVAPVNKKSDRHQDRATISMASMASPGFVVKTSVNIPEKKSTAFSKISSSRVAVRAAEEAAPPPLAVDDESPQPTPIAPKRGTKVKILRKESYWFNRIGSVVAVDQNPKTRYPVVVRLNEVNYADVSTNNFGLDEIEELNDQ